MNLVRVYVLSRDWSQARNVLGELLQVKPDSQAAHEALGELADRQRVPTLLPVDSDRVGCIAIDRTWNRAGWNLLC